MKNKNVIIGIVAGVCILVGGGFALATMSKGSKQVDGGTAGVLDKMDEAALVDAWKRQKSSIVAMGADRAPDSPVAKDMLDSLRQIEAEMVERGMDLKKVAEEAAASPLPGMSRDG